MNPSQNPSSLQSKSEITKALLHLMKQYPYSEISVKQIILETSLVSKTFYRNFTSKDDVLDSYINNIMSDYISTLQSLNDCRLSNILNVIFDFCIKYKSFLFLLHKNQLLYLLLHKWNIFIPSIHEQITTPDSIFYKTYGHLNTDYILAFNIGSIWNIISKWIDNKMAQSPEEIKNTITAYLTNISKFM